MRTRRLTAPPHSSTRSSRAAGSVRHLLAFTPGRRLSFESQQEDYYLFPRYIKIKGEMWREAAPSWKSNRWKNEMLTSPFLTSITNLLLPFFLLVYLHFKHLPSQRWGCEHVCIRKCVLEEEKLSLKRKWKPSAYIVLLLQSIWSLIAVAAPLKMLTFFVFITHNFFISK